jgi:hypothetical protein
VTFSERTGAIQKLGFTERQARFLVTVLLHAGVCMDRQYCAFAGIRHGQKTQDFFAKLIERRFATMYRCAHGRARIFHLQRKTLYDVIGERDSRLRRPTPIARAIERLMVLDAVLTSPETTWLTTERDKVAHFSTLLKSRLTPDELPRLTFGSGTQTTVRYFPDRLPVAVRGEGQGPVFTYLVSRAVPVDFRQFLHRHADLLRALPRWSIRLLVPAHLADVRGMYEAAWREECASPLRPSTAEELRWYFEQRRRRDEGESMTTHEDEARYVRARDAFGAPRYRVLYRSWRRNEPVVMSGVVSSVLADAVSRGTGTLEQQILPHHYLHLASLVTTA